MGMTIRDIAREAGVSTATVSRALRGLPNVDPVTRAKVHAVAERLDYVVSPAASRLASGRAGSIAVITPFVARWYFATVLSGVERVLQRSDLDLLLFSRRRPERDPPGAPAPQAAAPGRRVPGHLARGRQPGPARGVRAGHAGHADRLDPRGRDQRRDRRRRGRPGGHPAPDQPGAPPHRDHLRAPAAEPVHAGAGPLPRVPRRRQGRRDPRRAGVRHPRLLHDRGRRGRHDQPALAGRRHRPPSSRSPTRWPSARCARCAATGCRRAGTCPSWGSTVTTWPTCSTSRPWCSRWRSWGPRPPRPCSTRSWTAAASRSRSSCPHSWSCGVPPGHRTGRVVAFAVTRSKPNRNRVHARKPRETLPSPIREGKDDRVYTPGARVGAGTPAPVGGTMTARANRSRIALLGSAVVGTLVLAACSSSSGGAGSSAVNTDPACAAVPGLHGSLGDDRDACSARSSRPSRTRCNKSWAEFDKCTGITIAYEGSNDFESQLPVRVQGGTAPDLAIIPQPGLLAQMVSPASRQGPRRGVARTSTSTGTRPGSRTARSTARSTPPR